MPVSLVFGSVKGTSGAQSMPSQWWLKGICLETLIVGLGMELHHTKFQAAGIPYTFLWFPTGDLVP
ncbi:hypothetical protein Sinac_1848 [Singulisphaera acidiphila DSM 18658]|uniref:Uncharacterized protein n=1 Tax=Singulisphaera acidiphila (strain ATCC BAA-1392 / DSM 18658 / VKM B-2454 / MOB10) TaxID=886293 RepID=L0DAD7_SINAD|nr:hypothetical protein Sinac_1848 [Singulisphaera acidiphila DSM 18658]